MIQGIRENIREMVNSDFYRDIAGLFSGIFAARLIPAVFALAIARIYLPDHFGLFVLFLSIASLLSIFTTGGYERAILLTNTHTEKRIIFSFAFKINLILNSVILAGIFAYILVIGDVGSHTVGMLLMIPVFAFFFGNIQLIRNILISNKQFKELSLLEIIRAVLTGVLQLLFFILPETGLFAGIVIAQIFTYFYYNWKIPEASMPDLVKISKHELTLARRYVNFPKYSVPSELFNYLSSQLPVFMIKPFFGDTLLGLYSFSHRYLSIPVQLTSFSIGSVYVQKAQSLKEQPEELSRLTYNLFRRQFLLAILPFTVLALWGNLIFRFAFGFEWELSGTLSQLISPWLFAVFIGSPLSTILIVMEKQKISMIFNIVMLVFRALALAIGGLLIKEITLTIALYSLVGFLFFSGLTAYSLKLAGVNLMKVFWFSVRVIFAVLLPLLFLKIWL